MTKDLLNSIKEPIAIHLQSFDDLFQSSTEKSIPLIKELATYVNSSKGKQIRPIFTMLSAGLYNNITPKTIRAALALELLHTATLAHDDVVDNSTMRRHKQTINALWGNKIAILTGDYFLTILLEILISNKDFEILEIVSDTVKKIVEGEFLQQQKSVKFDYSEENYFDIIFKKTAVLIGACCKAGALSAGENVAEANKMYEVGRLVGLAFQIKDDILDYSLDSNSGKQPGNDIKELKFTLPLIHYIHSISETEREILLNDLKDKNTDDDFVTSLIHKVVSMGSIEYAEKKIEELCIQAKKEIGNIKPSIYKNLFLQTINYISLRDK